MEVQSLYDDGFNRGRGALKKLKANMTLDFNCSDKQRLAKASGMLASPDLQMLKLASPDLEKLIIQSNGMVTTTPTMAGTPSQILYPKSVTEEQEAYARGFVDALAELHKKEVGVDGCNGMEVSEDDASPPNASTYTTLTTMSNSAMVSRPEMMTTSVAAGQPILTSVAAQQPQVTSFNTTVSQLPGSNILSSVTSSSSSNHLPSNYQAPSPHLSGLQSLPTSRTQSPALSLTGVPTTVNGDQLLHLKEEPQTVPDVSPINMENQERIKLERKRARNRLAARKCRTRKLERISRLEERVDELKGQNNDLSKTATALREQVCKLKEQIMVHVNSGCKVMLSPNLL